MTNQFFEGYPDMSENDIHKSMRALLERPSDIEFVPFTEGLGTEIVVENINPGKNPRVEGAFHDKQGEIEGYFMISVPVDGTKLILVPPDKITIG